jgi:hypothetical protein
MEMNADSVVDEEVWDRLTEPGSTGEIPEYAGI